MTEPRTVAAPQGEARMQIRAGDVVLHRPSGERWVVAYARPSRDELGWCGWPEGIAKLSDCELVKACSDDEHEAMLRDWASKTGDDHRIRRAQEGLADLALARTAHRPTGDER